MATSHVEQMGCGSCEDVSALGTAKVTSGSVALLDHLYAVSRRVQRLFPSCECCDSFHTGKSGSAAFFQGPRSLSIRVGRHNGGKDPGSCQGVSRVTPLLHIEDAEATNLFQYTPRN